MRQSFVVDEARLVARNSALPENSTHLSNSFQFLSQLGQFGRAFSGQECRAQSISDEARSAKTEAPMLSNKLQEGLRFGWRI